MTDVVEIEAKLLIPDRATFDKLLLCTAMAGFELAPPHALVVQDAYLDTAGRALLAGGFACRRRVQDGRIIMTVKSVSTAGDSIHRRRELEVELAQEVPPPLWPAGEARDMVIRLSEGAPLEELFRIRQERFARQAFDGGRVVALMSLDQVAVEDRGGGRAWMEMEIELMPGGREKDLAAMAAWARARFHLQPSLLSKFERALGEPA
jgi:inorganic triphosphatase YgiF